MFETKRIYGTALTIALLPLLFAVSLCGWRVDFFQIYDKKGSLIFSSPAAVGHKFYTRYIHSVELTPVEDDYIVVDGKLWSWEERVRRDGTMLMSASSKVRRAVRPMPISTRSRMRGSPSSQPAQPG